MSSRCAKAESASIRPLTASSAPGTRRAAASTSPGRISVFDGMQPQYEHSPPTSSRSTSATESPPAAQRSTATSPAGPPPTTMTSKVSVTSSSLRRGSTVPPARGGRGARRLGGGHLPRGRRTRRPRRRSRSPASALPVAERVEELLPERGGGLGLVRPARELDRRAHLVEGVAAPAAPDEV